jgi:hypothetical protein
MKQNPIHTFIKENSAKALLLYLESHPKETKYSVSKRILDNELIKLDGKPNSKEQNGLSDRSTQSDRSPVKGQTHNPGQHEGELESE